MQAYVRDPKGQMPIFSREILSDYEIARIHAYLTSLPPGPPKDRIALLSNGTPPASNSGDGPAVSGAAMPLEHGFDLRGKLCGMSWANRGG
jgi:hypothetical protein